MYAIHFYEDKTYVLNQALRNIPSIDDNVSIKGRKAKVLNVEEIKENVYYVFIEFEKIVVKSKTATKELGKKKKR
jgi:hypothetical protein